MKSVLLAICAALAITLASGPALAQTLKTVVIQGDASPEGATFQYRRFRSPVISDVAGEHVAAFARTRGGKRCIFRLDPDAPPGSTIVCERDTLTPDNRQYRKIGDLSIDVAGEVAWTSRLTFGHSGAYRGTPGSVTVVALLGTSLPVTTGALDKLSNARITDVGDVVFQSTISGGPVVGGVTIDEGIFRCSGGDGNCNDNAGVGPVGTGTLSEEVLLNDPVPDRPGREICGFGAMDASSFGITFRATTKLDCADAAEIELRGVFRMPTGGAIVTVALAGEASNPVPGPGGTSHATFGPDPSISNTGFVAFRSETFGIASDVIIYLCDPATCPAALAEVAVSDGNANPDGYGVYRFISPPTVSDVGDIAFYARLAAGSLGSASGVFAYRRATGVGNEETIVVSEDPVPGDPTSEFKRFVRGREGPPGMSAGGRIGFRAKIKRAVAPRNRHGLFAFE